MNDITDNDKLMAALAWVIPIVGIVILVAEGMKDRPFQRYHAVNSLAFNVAFFVILTIISAVTFGFGGCLFVLWFISIFWAIKAYQGEYVNVPVISDFVKKQGWV
ncbi:MAG TPA: hypothetical protein PKE64_07810 [Anaerolineae bacterium]|nr:hypothetical protein [Anaerolineae bacterium]HMR63899.1 hypothetical protein [Anaerolineae bacterium]